MTQHSTAKLINESVAALKKVFSQLAGPFIIENIKNNRGELVVPGLQTIINQLSKQSGLKRTSGQAEIKVALEKLKKEDWFDKTFLATKNRDYVLGEEGRKKIIQRQTYYNRMYRRLIQEQRSELTNQETKYLLSTLSENSISKTILTFLKARNQKLWKRIVKKSKNFTFSHQASSAWQDLQNTFINQNTKLAVGNPGKKPFGDSSSINYPKLQRQISQRVIGGIFSVSGIRQIFSPFFGDQPLPQRFPWRLGIETQITLAAKVHAATQARLFVEMLAAPKKFTNRIPLDAIMAKNTAKRKLKYQQIKKDFIDLLTKTQAGKNAKSKKIAVFLDTRSTGPALADIDIRTLLANGARVEYGFVSSVCQAAVYIKENPNIIGGIYISASHNDEGYNGIKLFLGDGRIMPQQVAYPYIFVLRNELAKLENTKKIIKQVNSIPAGPIKTVFNQISLVKNKSKTADWDYRDRVITGFKGKNSSAAIKKIRFQISRLKLAIVVDPNGGSREDAEYFKKLGFRVYQINPRPRYDMNHELCPSTAAVAQTDQALRQVQNKSRQQGYRIIGSLHYDTDGDRRNFRPVTPNGKFLLRDDMAQICFALDVISYVLDEENYDLIKHIPKNLLGVACNGPTSILLEELAEKLGFVLIRTQTGEAYVVDGMERLANLTWQQVKAEAARGQEEIFVPASLEKVFDKSFDSEKIKVIIAGEGSNGSDFTQELLVRDPLHTIKAIINFINPTGGPKIVKTLLKRLGRENEFSAAWWSKKNIASIISRLINFLPLGQTTDFFTIGGPGEMVNPPLLVGLVKDNFDQIFNANYKEQTIKNLGKILSVKTKSNFPEISCQYINYEESAKIGFGRRNKSAPIGRQVGDGGYKIKFFCHKTPLAWIWFRDSITEKGLTRVGASVIAPSALKIDQKTVNQIYNLLKKVLANCLKDAVKATSRQILTVRSENLDPRFTPYQNDFLLAQQELRNYYKCK